jgi:hypothetical protein
VLIKEGPPEENPWGIKFSTMFHMTNDSYLFRSCEQLEPSGYKLKGNRFIRGEETYLPLYEGKMFMPFDHRFANVIVTDNVTRPGQPEFTTLGEHLDPHFAPIPRFWVGLSEAREKLNTGYRYEWVLGLKDITAPTNERTFLATLLPLAGVANSIPLMLPLASPGAVYLACLASNLNCFAFDFTARRKMGNVHLNFYIVEQLPILPPSTYAQLTLWSQGEVLHQWLTPRVLELTYTAWDLESFANDCGYCGPPFLWDEARRFLLRCELDAAYFHLYGIARDDVDYIMETFPIVKHKDKAQFGEYRTKRVILEIYDAMQNAIDASETYGTLLDPPPADPCVTHKG